MLKHIARKAIIGVASLGLTILSAITMSAGQAQAQTAYISPSAPIKSVDVMKYTKDVMTGQPSDAAIASIVQTLKGTGADYVAISVPMDATADYPAGNKPAPRTAEAFTQAWADAIHNAGLHVIWRGTFAGLEGIYGFTQEVGADRFPAGTASSAATDGQSTWLGKIYQYITGHPSYFQNGDIWAPLPERTQGIFSDSTSFLPDTGAGIQANYASFFADLKTVSDQAFGKIGKSVMTGLSANNASEVMSTWIPQSLYSDAGYTVVDYYGTDHTPQEMDTQIRAMAAATGKPVFIQEWSDYWDQGMDQAQRTAYLESMYAEMSKLEADGVLAGVNYWGGWVNDAEGILSQSTSGTFSLNTDGQTLSSFFGDPVGSSGSTGASGQPSSGSIGASSASPVLGGLNLNSYCSGAGQGSPTLANGQWSCGGTPMTMTDVCTAQYGSQAASAAEAVSGNAYTWQCYGPIVGSSPGSSAGSQPSAGSVSLGGIDLGSYCASIGEGGAALVKGQWDCTNGGNDAQISMDSACSWQYPGKNAVAEQSTAGNSSSWSCYSQAPAVAQIKLGGLNLNSYCSGLNEGAPSLAGGSWSCGTGSASSAIDMTRACVSEYSSPAAVAKEAVPNDQYTWNCYSS